MQEVKHQLRTVADISQVGSLSGERVNKTKKIIICITCNRVFGDIQQLFVVYHLNEKQQECYEDDMYWQPPAKTKVGHICWMCDLLRADEHEDRVLN